MVTRFVSFVCFVRYEKLNNMFVCLRTGECFTVTILGSSSMVLRKFCLLCYKSVISMIPRRIKDKFGCPARFGEIEQEKHSYCDLR